MHVPVGIALGSNLGDRQAELDAGIALLASLAVDGRVLTSERLETEPVDCPEGSRPFLNAVAEIEVDTASLPPQMLLARLQAFEVERGRSAAGLYHAPRPLDLDLLYYGARIVDEPGLTLPHPRLTGRRFVLQPLAQIRPDLVLPGQSKTVRELLAALG